LAEFGSHPAWSPDGSSIVFQSIPPTDLGTNARTMPPSVLWIMSAQGGDLRQLTRAGEPPGGHASPSWSPDGKRIVFAAADSFARGVWTISVTGGGLQRFLDSGADPVYSRDGEAIYFSERDAELWKLRIAPGGEPVGEPVKVTSPGPAALRYPTVSA